MSIPQIHQLGEVHDTNTNNWKLCIICQSDDESKGQLVQRPQIDSYHKLLSAVCERADLNDGQYVQI